MIKVKNGIINSSNYFITVALQFIVTTSKMKLKTILHHLHLLMKEENGIKKTKRR